jgi:RNA polymerase sigma-70 factor, ECF subfamily
MTKSWLLVSILIGISGTFSLKAPVRRYKNRLRNQQQHATLKILKKTIHVFSSATVFTIRQRAIKDTMAVKDAVMTGKESWMKARDELTIDADCWNLVLRAREGDGTAFEALVELYGRQVLGTAVRILHDTQEAQDATQEVFLKLHRNLSQIRADADLRAWIYRVTVNVCRDLWKKHRWYRLFVSGGHVLETINYVVSDQTEERLMQQEQLKIFAQALDSLPFKERTAIVLRDIQGLGTEETARILGSSAATVRSQVASARIKIKHFADRALRRKP